MNEENINIIKYLDRELLEVINQKEEERKKHLKFAKIFILIIVGIVFIPLLFSTNSRADDVLSIFLIIIIILFICYKLFLNILFEGLKEKIISQFIEAIKIQFSYAPEKSLTENDFINCSLFEKPDYFSASELFEGKIDKTYIKFGYVSAQVEKEEIDFQNDISYEDDYYYDDDDIYINTTTNVSTKHSTKTVNIFSGYLYCADFNKKIFGTTKLYPKNIINFSKGLLFENPEFISSFIVKSTDEIEARYILSLSMLEKIMNLRKKYGKFYISFKDNWLYLAYPISKIDLKFSLFKPISDEYNSLRGYITIINLANDIVNELDLNTRIWTKD